MLHTQVTHRKTSLSSLSCIAHSTHKLLLETRLSHTHSTHTDTSLSHTQHTAHSTQHTQSTEHTRVPHKDMAHDTRSTAQRDARHMTARVVQWCAMCRAVVCHVSCLCAVLRVPCVVSLCCATCAMCRVFVVCYVCHGLFERETTHRLFERRTHRSLTGLCRSMCRSHRCCVSFTQVTHRDLSLSHTQHKQHTRAHRPVPTQRLSQLWGRHPPPHPTHPPPSLPSC